MQVDVIASRAETTLRWWAECGTRLWASESARLQGPSFNLSTSGLIEESRLLREVEFRELDRVVDQSRRHLHPLGEPLEYDLGLHRWLAKAREEAYSDWFQWLFGQMTCQELARVLELPCQARFSNELVRAEREVWVERGYEGRSGRLDLLLHLQDYILVLEVKLGAAEPDAKQLGYAEATKERFPKKALRFVMLGTKTDHASVSGFDVRTYPCFCLRLRELSREWMKCETRLFAAAMTLALVAAIETNLLGFSTSRRSLSVVTLSHLTAFVDSLEGV